MEHNDEPVGERIKITNGPDASIQGPIPPTIEK